MAPKIVSTEYQTRRMPGLKDERTQQGLRVSDLAAKARSTLVTIKKLERGGRAQKRTRQRIADALGIPLERFDRCRGSSCN